MKSLSLLMLLAITCSCAPTNNPDVKPFGSELLPDFAPTNNHVEKLSDFELLHDDVLYNIFNRCQPIFTSKLFSLAVKKSSFGRLKLTDAQEAVFKSMTAKEKSMAWKLGKDEDKFLDELKPWDWPHAIEVAVEVSNRQFICDMLARAPLFYLGYLFPFKIPQDQLERQKNRHKLTMFEKLLTKDDLDELSELQGTNTQAADVRFILHILRNAKFIKYPNFLTDQGHELGLRIAIRQGNVRAAWMICAHHSKDWPKGLGPKYDALVETAEKQFTETELHDLSKLRSANDNLTWKFYFHILFMQYEDALLSLLSANEDQQEFALQLSTRYGNRRTTVALLGLGKWDFGEDWEQRGGMFAKAMHDLGESNRADVEKIHKNRKHFLAIHNNDDDVHSRIKIDTKAVEYEMQLNLAYRIFGNVKEGNVRAAIALVNCVRDTQLYGNDN